MIYQFDRPNLHVLITTRLIDSSENITDEYDKLLLSRTYPDACLNVGVMPHLTPVIPKEFASYALDGMDGLIISGGSDIDPSLYGQKNKGSIDTIPEMDESDMALIKEAKKKNIPVLGICRGMQMLNVVCGGTLKQHISNVYEDHPSVPKSKYKKRAYRHEVKADEGSWVHSLLGERFETNSIHHQAIDLLGHDLLAVAHTEDGIVESIEHNAKDWFAIGVQWHPEQLDNHDEFFSNWLNKVLLIKESKPKVRRAEDHK